MSHQKRGGLVLLQLVWFALPNLLIGCATTRSSAVVNRRDPEPVLRAYFDAWAHNDATRQQSFMTSNYAGLVSEPVDSLRVLSIKPIDPLAGTTRVFAVSFDIKSSSPGSSVPSGRHEWTYTLTWDRKSEGWLISNYGAG